MVGLQTLDLAVGVRVPASQPLVISDFRFQISDWLRSVSDML